MHLTNFHFYNTKNYLYSNPVKGLRGCGVSYRFGFNGVESDNEIAGCGNFYSFEYRVQDVRTGRFLSIDPLVNEYPWNSPYAFAENRVIDGKDLEGLEYTGANGQPAGPLNENHPENKGANLEPQFQTKSNNSSVNKTNIPEFPIQSNDGNKSQNPSSKVKENIKMAQQITGIKQPPVTKTTIRGNNYTPLIRVPDAFGVQLSGTAIEGVGISQNTNIGYMSGKGMFQTIGPGEGVGHDAGLSIQVFGAWYSGNDPDNKFDAYVGNSVTANVGFSVLCGSNSRDISANGSGGYAIGQNWSTWGGGVSLGTDDVSTLFSGSVQYQQSFEVVWGDLFK